MKKDKRYYEADGQPVVNGLKLLPLQYRMIVRTADGRLYRSPWQAMSREQAEHGATVDFDRKENFNITVKHRGHSVVIFGRSICSIEFEERGRAD